MGEWLTGEQLQARNIEVMGRELGELYNALYSETLLLFWRWRQLTVLSENAARIEILNRSAPFFFYVIEDVLWSDTVLGIARLTGPPNSGVNKDNLTVRRLASPLLSAELDGPVGESVRSLMRMTEFAQDWRNRRLAHRDLRLSLGRVATPLPDGKRAEVEAALGGIAGVLNMVQSAYHNGGTTAFDSYFMQGDAETLLYVLRDGLRMREIREERMDVGEDWSHMGPL
jgi:hypothetical protein